MALKCGLVGLPNVGKSTLFNALIRKRAASAANYPFCTIEPFVGEALLDDTRLDKLVEISKSKNRVPASLRFVDIAGLVKGASQGQGLGNQFLGAIRQVDVIVHVLRGFEDKEIIHVEGRVDPINDAELIETELLLADLDWIERKLKSIHKKMRSNDRETVAINALGERFLEALKSSLPASSVELNAKEEEVLVEFDLLTLKPVIFVLNVKDSASSFQEEIEEKLHKFCKERNSVFFAMCGKTEEELIDLDPEDAAEMSELLGYQEAVLNKLAFCCYEKLNLITFFTSGEKESKAWQLQKGQAAEKAAGKIHSDIERGFIAAEVCHYDDFVLSGGEKQAKEQGKIRLEGRDYTVKDGDIINFRFNV